MAYETNRCPDFPQSPSLPPNYTCIEIYTVKTGDTLYAISQAYGVPVAVLMQVNRILNPYNLKTGQKICIPGRQSGGDDAMPGCGGTVHTIAKGDTLYMIAKRYQVPLAVIMRANPNIDPYNLKIGQKLCIPNFPAEQPMPAPPAVPVPPVEPVPPMPPSPPVAPAPPMPPAPPAAPPSEHEPMLPTPSLPACVNGRPYQTQRGDTLTRILDRFGITYGQLLAANPDVDFEGSLETLILCIPYKEGENECGGMGAYVVRDGDTLDSISRQFSILADHLLMANPDLMVDDFSVPGVTICIPG